ncbi:MAG: hypothetical protein QGI21_06285 [Candidatus Poseidoniaceae archaeon]|jgi:hypothetical protein|nr:hypothetical protein [Candidatus Poseidoniaceae archaeon]
MLDDGAEDLFEGFWPFIQRIAFVFLPLWVYLLFWSAKMPTLVSAIAAGSSLSLIVLYEKLKLRQKNNTNSEGNNLIK